MDGKLFELLVKTEYSAQAYLRKLCWENYRRFCIRCHSNQLYRIAGKKFRCKLCGYTFHDFSGRWINKGRIGSRNWLMIIKLFEQEFPARHIAEKVMLSYPTILKALVILRLAIIANATDSEIWLDHVYFHPMESETNQKAQRMIAVFGIIEQHGKVKIDILKGYTLKTLLRLKPKMLRRSSIYYTDACQPYEALVFSDYGNAHDSINNDDANRMYQVNWKSDFWHYAKTKISRYRGIHKEKLPLYLKELEFRYNHRDQQIFDLLCGYLVNFIPTG